MARTDNGRRHQDAQFISERQLSERWGLSTRTLQRWRADRHGPGFSKIGGSIRYNIDDVIAFEASAPQAGTEEPAEGA